MLSVEAMGPDGEVLRRNLSVEIAEEAVVQKDVAFAAGDTGAIGGQVVGTREGAMPPHVYVYEQSAGWQQTAKLSATDALPADTFGTAIGFDHANTQVARGPRGMAVVGHAFVDVVNEHAAGGNPGVEGSRDSAREESAVQAIEIARRPDPAALDPARARDARAPTTHGPRGYR